METKTDAKSQILQMAEILSKPIILEIEKDAPPPVDKRNMKDGKAQWHHLPEITIPQLIQQQFEEFDTQKLEAKGRNFVAPSTTPFFVKVQSKIKPKYYTEWVFWSGKDCYYFKSNESDPRFIEKSSALSAENQGTNMWTDSQYIYFVGNEGNDINTFQILSDLNLIQPAFQLNRINNPIEGFIQSVRAAGSSLPVTYLTIKYHENIYNEFFLLTFSTIKAPKDQKIYYAWSSALDPFYEPVLETLFTQELQIAQEKQKSFSDVLSTNSFIYNVILELFKKDEYFQRLLNDVQESSIQLQLYLTELQKDKVFDPYSKMIFYLAFQVAIKNGYSKEQAYQFIGIIIYKCGIYPVLQKQGHIFECLHYFTKFRVQNQYMELFGKLIEKLTLFPTKFCPSSIAQFHYDHFRVLVEFASKNLDEFEASYHKLYHV